jgi:hypothetical protein
MRPPFEANGLRLAILLPSFPRMHESCTARLMKIICLEEHTHDAAVAKATLPAAAKQAPYLADLGSRYQEEPSSDRPRLQSPKRAVELASAPVENRLPAMDADGIDMQVLSDSNSMQSAPIDSAVELARAVNNR